MLYKKFHRNYVSRFKIGVMVRSINGNNILDVTTKPIIGFNLITRRFYVTFRLDENEVLPLVFSSGRLMYYNVVQEISQELR